MLLYDALCSHDCVPRYSLNRITHELSLIDYFYNNVPRGANKTWSAFSASSFTYSLVGLSMLAFFNRRLPDVFWQTSVVDVNLYALILVVQGFFSWWADVWARTIACEPQHVAYLIDRAFATPMTILTLYLGMFCWFEPSSPVGRTLASCTALGLVPFVGSQLALRSGRYERFMALHICWHVSIPLVALLWLGHEACGWSYGFARVY